MTEENTGTIEPTTAFEVADHYVSQDNLSPDFKILMRATKVSDKEAFVVFSYGGQRFKVTFEEVKRVRVPKSAKQALEEAAKEETAKEENAE